MDKTALGDRMKAYEKQFGMRLTKGLPIVIRLDGSGFSRWTRDLQKPHDLNLAHAMDECTKMLIDKTNAVVGYTQSDEISLILFEPDVEKDLLYGGRVQKLCSELASQCSVYFNSFWKDRKLAIFDCRVFNVPSKEEAVNCLVWRELDATRNAISGLAQCYFSHKELFEKNTGQMQEMLFQGHGINFNDCSVGFKRGRYFRRVRRAIKFSAEELSRLPEKHAARQNPDLTFNRAVIEYTEFEKPLNRLENRVELIFGETP